MKIFVCYHKYNWEGCSEPEAIFTNEEDAAKWCIDKRKHSDEQYYKEFEIDVSK